MRRTAGWLAAIALLVGVSTTHAAALSGSPSTGECSNSPCGGDCILCPPCTPGLPCPEMACVPGQCQTASGSCVCVPGVPSPTPSPATCDQNCAPGSRCGDFPCGPGVCVSSGSACVCVPPPCAFPTPTPPCDSAACGGDCTISVPCPNGPPCPEAPELLGQCVTTSTGGCECLPIGPTPPATPTPQCTGATCGGPCTVAFSPFPCPPGMACPIVTGQCEMDPSGTCACVPVVPTPPTPVPQCSSAACSGKCVIEPPPFPFPPGAFCVGMGECQTTATGECECVPLPTPTAGPSTPTPTPQCAGVPCGGSCITDSALFPCPLGVPCRGAIGQCETDPSGNCECVPIVPTPPATPTPQCTGDSCGGPCTITFPPLQCPRPGICSGAELPVISGQCAMTGAGGCACIPVSPTPRATPTPECSGATCEGPCIIAVPCPPDVPCPDLAMLGQCEADATGACACMPPTPAATPTPACSSGACAGACVITSPPFFCPPGKECNGPDVPVLAGQCEVDPNGDCECVPATPLPSPSPLATPTPQCDAIPCGGPCVIAPPCLPQGCELPSLLGACDSVSGSCVCVPATPLTGSASVPNGRVVHSPHHRHGLSRRPPRD